MTDHVHILDAESGAYIDTGHTAEIHPFLPAATEDLCLHRMAERYICQSPQAAPIHGQGQRGES